MTKHRLFNEFSPVSAVEWKRKIQSDLKGADYEQTLIWESPEGIHVQPFYHADNVPESIYLTKQESSWSVGQKVNEGDAKTANDKALLAVGRGAESLSFVVPSEDTNLEILLKDIDIKRTPLYFKLGFLSSEYIRNLLALAGDAPEKVYLNLDPIGHLVRSGNWFRSEKADMQNVRDVLSNGTPNVVGIDLAHYQNAGADRVQQLAYALAHANEYLNAFSEGACAPATFTFKVSVDTNYFFEIAKIRALRLLWASLMTAYENPIACHIVAYPTHRNKTLYDYNINMLRTTTECMAAVLGGADCVMNLAYDVIYHEPNEFGERIALNQLLLLKNESYFDKVANPADGAYYIETLTRELAEKALALFKSVEKEGGFLKQLEIGTVQDEIAKSAERQQQRFEAGEEVLVGTNRYQNENDKMKDTIERHPFTKTNTPNKAIRPIVARRLAEHMEQKRLQDE